MLNHGNFITITKHGRRIRRLVRGAQEFRKDLFRPGNYSFRLPEHPIFEDMQGEVVYYDEVQGEILDMVRRYLNEMLGTHTATRLLTNAHIYTDL